MSEETKGNNALWPTPPRRDFRGHRNGRRLAQGPETGYATAGASVAPLTKHQTRTCGISKTSPSASALPLASLHHGSDLQLGTRVGSQATHRPARPSGCPAPISFRLVLAPHGSDIGSERRPRQPHLRLLQPCAPRVTLPGSTWQPPAGLQRGLHNSISNVSRSLQEANPLTVCH